MLIKINNYYRAYIFFWPAGYLYWLGLLISDVAVVFEPNDQKMHIHDYYNKTYNCRL